MPSETTASPPVINPLDVMLAHVEEVEDELVRSWLQKLLRSESETEEAA